MKRYELKNNHLTFYIVADTFELAITEAICLYKRCGLIGRFYLYGENGKVEQIKY